MPELECISGSCQNRNRDVKSELLVVFSLLSGMKSDKYGERRGAAFGLRTEYGIATVLQDGLSSDRYSRSPSPWEEKSRSRSRSRSRSVPRLRERSRSIGRGRSPEVSNPGNALYVTGLSTRVTERDLQDHFSKEGKVKSVFLVVEPRSQISRGFAFITMDTLDDANRCIKYLNQSILEGRYITVERVFWSAMLQQSKIEFIHIATI